MITFFGTDVTLVFILAIGLFVGYIIGQNKRLRTENRKLANKAQVNGPLHTKSYTTDAGR